MVPAPRRSGTELAVGPSAHGAGLRPEAGTVKIPSVKIFFVTDLHGSEICWKKFLNAGSFYGADVVILGGDVTGKAMVPIVQRPNGTWEASSRTTGTPSSPRTRSWSSRSA